jgi:hypothetical protein
VAIIYGLERQQGVEPNTNFTAEYINSQGAKGEPLHNTTLQILSSMDNVDVKVKQSAPKPSKEMFGYKIF